MYYLRSKAATDPIKFTLSQKHQQKFVATPTGQQNDHKDNGYDHTGMHNAASPVAAPTAMKPVEPQVLATGKVCSLDDPTCEACSA
jgi:hypothetical protein